MMGVGIGGMIAGLTTSGALWWIILQRIRRIREERYGNRRVGDWL